MAENSFYGGHPGFSCIIARSFPSVSEMIKNFKLGGSYSEVHYNEYVLINTPDKNDPENGQIYRRGYDYTNDKGGAIYIGAIVGPAGQSPHLVMTTVEDIEKKHEQGGQDDRFAEGMYEPTVDLIPGKDGDQYNDGIKWASYSMMEPNGVDTTAYIGFVFPYLVEEFIGEKVSAYEDASHLIERVDEGDHPFYQEWKIKVPQGIKGDALKDFRVMVASDEIEEYPDRAGDIAGARKVLVYDYYNYDTDPEGTKTTLYLGDYNMIESIEIDDQGTVTIGYTHEDDKVFDKLFKWIDSVTLDTETGHFTVTYNQKNGEDPVVYEADLTWVKDLNLADDGTITLTYTYGESKSLDAKLKWVKQIEMAEDGTVTVTYNDETQEVFDKRIQWVTNISLSQDGTFTIEYNNGTDNYVAHLKWVRDITIDEAGTIKIIYNDNTETEYKNYLKTIQDVTLAENGDVTVEYNTGEQTVFESGLKSIKNIDIDEEGTLTVTYNNGETDSFFRYMKIIKNISINSDNGGGEGSGDQMVYVEYNTGENEAIGSPLNYVVETDVNEYYHLLVYYSDPRKREQIPPEKKVSHKGKEGWLDLGSIKDEDGILIGLNIDPAEAGSTIEEVIEHLNGQYPTGLVAEGQKGKIVTVGGTTEQKNKDFYAFDYNKNSWYYLGSFDIGIDSLIIVGSADDPSMVEKKSALTPGGIWFVVEGEDDIG